MQSCNYEPSSQELDGLAETDRRVDHFRNILTRLSEHPRRSPEWLVEAFLKVTEGDPVALVGIPYL